MVRGWGERDRNFVVVRVSWVVVVVVVAAVVGLGLEREMWV